MEFDQDVFCVEKVTSPTSPYLGSGKLVKYNGTEAVVTVPEGVAEIGSTAFAENCCVEEVILPESARSIERGAFADCKNLKKVVFPQRLAVIDSIAFAGCTELDQADVPDSVGFVGETAFIDCKKLQESWRARGLCILCGHKLNKGLFKNTCPRCRTVFKK